jgi:O-antigen/teichoic acid export membrane protein
MGLALLTAPIVARALGPDGRGETAAALAAFSLIPIFLAIGVPLEIRRLAAQGPAHSVVRSARDLWIFALVPATLVAFSLDATIFRSLGPDTRLIIFVGATLAPLSMSWAADVSVLVARGRYRRVMILRLIQPVVFTVGTVVFWATGVLSVHLVLLTHISATVITAIVGLTFVRVPLRGERVSRRWLIRNGLKFAGSAIAEAASNRLDQVLLLPLIGASGSGLYAVAVTIASLPMALGQALGATYFRSVALATDKVRPEIIAAGVRAAASITFLVCGTLAALSPLLIPLLFGESFRGAVAPAIVSLIGAFALTVGYVCSMMLASQGRGIRMTIAQVTALGVALVLLYLLAPLYGAVGASTASAVSYLVLLGMLLGGLRPPVLSLLPTIQGARLALRMMFR